jgi:hypothetical protein
MPLIDLPMNDLDEKASQIRVILYASYLFFA